MKIFPFESKKKRMGIIVKNEEKIEFFLKGADDIMISKISNNSEKVII